MELTLHFITLFLNFWCFHTARSGYTDPMITLVRKVMELESRLPKAGCQQVTNQGLGNNMYDLNGIELDNTVVKTDNGDLTEFEMLISIKTAKNVSQDILLSPLNSPGSGDLVFVIGVGTAMNQNTVLRIDEDSSKVVARVFTPGILSARKYTNFYITISNSVLKFSKQGEPPIISYSDIRLKNIKYFGVRSWGSRPGKFLLDCPIPDKS